MHTDDARLTGRSELCLYALHLDSHLGCPQTATRMDGHATKRPCVHDRRAHTAITTQHGGRFLLVFHEFDNGPSSFQRVFSYPALCPLRSGGSPHTVQA